MDKIDFTLEFDFKDWKASICKCLDKNSSFRPFTNVIIDYVSGYMVAMNSWGFQVATCKFYNIQGPLDTQVYIPFSVFKDLSGKCRLELRGQEFQLYTETRFYHWNRESIKFLDWKKYVHPLTQKNYLCLNHTKAFNFIKKVRKGYIHLYSTSDEKKVMMEHYDPDGSITIFPIHVANRVCFKFSIYLNCHSILRVAPEWTGGISIEDYNQPVRLFDKNADLSILIPDFYLDESKNFVIFPEEKVTLMGRFKALYHRLVS